MAEPPPHPLAEPKGAGALALVLAVAGVLAPFLLDLNGALTVAAVATLLIAWLYLAEMREAIGRRQWSPTLKVPIGAVIIIVLMGALSITHQRRDSSAPGPVISAKDIADQIKSALKSEPSSPQLVISSNTGSSAHRIAPGLPAPLNPGTVTQSSQSAATIDSASTKIEAEIQQNSARLRARDDCVAREIHLSAGFLSLIKEATDDETRFNTNHDDDGLTQEYYTWLGKVGAFIYENKDFIPDAGSLEQARAAPGAKTFLLIHNRGYQIGRNFEAKRIALIDLNNAFAALGCDSVLPSGAAGVAR